MGELLSDIPQNEASAKAELDAAGTADALEQWRIRYLGSKGLLQSLFDRMKTVPPEQKKDVGKALNRLKTEWTAAHAEKVKAAGERPAAGPAFDRTLPPLLPNVGKEHVLTRVRREIADIFERMGFEQIHSLEVEDEFHNFVALNIPASHPARDPRDNFYITDKVLLRTQTSTAQIRVMQERKPPVRVIHCGRVYRPDPEDATHSDMFHQIEALAVDEGVTMAQLKHCILLFARTYFSPEVRTRFRPSFFPFTEPSAEVDITCMLCGGTGKRAAGPCGPCKGTGWIEMGGCGMVDPNVFAAVGYNPEKYTGFAFGLGIERIAMRKYGVPDIRLFHGRETGNDQRFLSQF
jgi:phenylalanyl-tRNA synthetase alpha chain